VEEIIEQWYGPDDNFYKVRVDDHVYLLRHHTSTDTWDIESVRNSR
jgi:hypothetical protein